jgi:hypothetical protein
MGLPSQRPPLVALALCLFAGLASCSSSDPSDGVAEFVVDVAGERFVMRVTEPQTIELARERMAGRNARFPAGPLRPGSGSFNAPWSWHLDPDATRMVEVAIEVCDGRPSYVEAHQADFPTYCPWGAQIVSER